MNAPDGFASRLLLLLAGVAATLVGVAALPAAFYGGILYADPLPDLVIQSISISPAAPALSETTYITVVVRNQGSAAAASTFTYVYVDPSDDPPISSTKQTTRSGAPLPAGGSYSIAFSWTFTVGTGCGHHIYAWVDRDGWVAESDETNNVVSSTVCVGVQGVADAFEPDDTCGTARWITNTQGLFPQAHTLWPPGDDDWVKFSAVAGVSYTIQTTNLQMHADPELYLLSSCGGLSQLGPAPRLDWRAPASGLYYVWVADGDARQGPLTAYSLTVSADTSGLYDPFEPDNTCNTAREIATDGAPQTHYFQAPDDADWVKFPIQGGETYVVVADDPGPNVSPQIALYSACSATFGGPVAQGMAPQVESSGPGMLYGRATNQGAGYGSTAHYNLRVNTVTCAPDGFEGDDVWTAAKLVATDGAAQTHNICPAGDRDWVKFAAISGTTYVLETTNLGPTADTEIVLYDTGGSPELARNDDYTSGLLNSRIVWQAPASGTYYAMIHHVKAQAAGANTRYDFSISQGACSTDVYEAGGDNGPLHAPVIAVNGSAQSHNLCPRGDQDWVRFQGGPGLAYTIQTSGLSLGADTVLYLYGPGGNLVAFNDDYGTGGASMITSTLPASGTYYIQVVHFDSNNFGSETAYSLTVQANAPPTPTPTPSPTPSPTPTPVPTPSPSSVHTLIVVNRQRVEDIYGVDASWQLMSKLYELAADPRVAGLVAQVEMNPSVATAYAAWTANQTSLLDSSKANDVAGAIRNVLLGYTSVMTDPRRIVIIGDDRIVPFRRVGDYTGKKEDQYASSVTISTTQWAALRDAMTLTDDYYADTEPSSWANGELYLPDFPIGRLVETPTEIIGMIDSYLGSGGVSAQRALITGYSFVQDTADVMDVIFGADSITVGTLISESWAAADLRGLQLEAAPRYDIQSINGHATHLAEKAPDGSAVTASDVVSGNADLEGAVIYTLGCHSGFNDTGSLDLAQAFAQRRSSYVANTGFGWGGGGTSYSEAIMRNFTLKLLYGQSEEIGQALVDAKHTYFNQASSIGSYDQKSLAEATLYGLPMRVITTGATFQGEDPFPSVTFTPTLPTGSFGRVSTGTLGFSLAGSFGAYEEVTNTQGTYFGQGQFFAINGNVHAVAGEPVQPQVFANLTAPQAGTLRGALFLGGIYTDVAGFDPVVVQPFNEYVTPTAEPAFTAPGWYPPVPFAVRSGAQVLGGDDSLVSVMGQFNSKENAERLYDKMAFATYYSADPDVDPPEIRYVAGVLNAPAGIAAIKVEATDDSAVARVVVAYTEGQGQWFSEDLAYNPSMHKWTGDIPGTAGTVYFVQAVDVAGNVQVAHNKGAYYPVVPPAPLVAGEGFRRTYLPLVLRAAGP